MTSDRLLQRKHRRRMSGRCLSRYSRLHRIHDQKMRARAHISRPSFVNEYSGWTLDADASIPRVTLNSTLTPRKFFERFVRTRKPCVLTGSRLKDPSWRTHSHCFCITSHHHVCDRADQRWSNKYMKRIAGDSTVRVERRGGQGESYGKGENVYMKFREFLKLLEEGDDMHYMTTQDLALDEDGRPDLLT